MMLLELVLSKSYLILRDHNQGKRTSYAPTYYDGFDGKASTPTTKLTIRLTPSYRTYAAQK